MDSTMTLQEGPQAKFKGLIPILSNMNALVVGCGSLGSHLIAMLSRMEPEAIYCIDYDKVEPTNLGVQDFREEEVGQFKAECLANKCERRRSKTIIMPYIMKFENFAPELLANRIKALTHVFSCVDNMKTREAIWEALYLNKWSGILVDGRLDSNVGWVYACRCLGINAGKEAAWYRRTLYSDSEVHPAAHQCAIQMTGYSAHGIAALMVGQAMRFSDRALECERLGMDYNNMLFFPADYKE